MILQYLYFLSIAFIVTFILMPFGFRIMRQYKLYDKPNERKIHSTNILSSGGAIIFLGILVKIYINQSSFFQQYYFRHLLLP